MDVGQTGAGGGRGGVDDDVLRVRGGVAGQVGGAGHDRVGALSQRHAGGVQGPDVAHGGELCVRAQRVGGAVHAHRQDVGVSGVEAAGNGERLVVGAQVPGHAGVGGDRDHRHCRCHGINYQFTCCRVVGRIGGLVMHGGCNVVCTVR